MIRAQRRGRRRRAGVRGAIRGGEGGGVLDARVYKFDDLLSLLFLPFLRLRTQAGVGGVVELDVQVNVLGRGDDGGFPWFGFLGVFNGDGDLDARGEADGLVEFGVVGARGGGPEGFALGFEDVIEDEAGVGVGCCVCGVLDWYIPAGPTTWNGIRYGEKGGKCREIAGGPTQYLFHIQRFAPIAASDLALEDG